MSLNGTHDGWARRARGSRPRRPLWTFRHVKQQGPLVASDTGMQRGLFELIERGEVGGREGR